MGGSDLTRPIVPLAAGPLTVGYHFGDVRYLRLGDHEVLRRIYGAVRGPQWETVPMVLHDERLEVQSDSFRLQFRAEHRSGEAHFVWDGLIEGHADGSLLFSFDGQALSTFRRNRIGLCVLHPLRECAGARCRTRYPDGSEQEARFPQLVSLTHPLPGFENLVGLDHQISADADVWAELRFEGDSFETEDQRNWMDASFKTYGTPSHLPRPVEIAAGTRLRQRVHLRLRGPVASLPPRFLTRSDEGQSEEILVGPTPEMVPLPALGLCSASHGGVLTRGELDRLAQLCLAHLRVDLLLSQAGWAARLRGSARDAMDLGLPLELALHFPAEHGAAPDLTELLRELRASRADIARVMAFRDGEPSTLADDLHAVQRAFAEFGVPIGSGTHGDFYQLGVRPPALAGADFLVWSMNPQAHASDTLSITETPEAVAPQLASARVHFPDTSLVISPITLRPRGSATPTISSEAPADPNAPPAHADPRQSSLFCAGWTLAVIQALALGGAESATLFETTGWCGVMASSQGAPLSNGWAAFHEAVFPVYHALADLGQFAGGKLERWRNSHPARVSIFGIRHRERSAALLANLTSQRETVVLLGPRPTRWRRLAAHQVSEAARHPEAFRGGGWISTPNASTSFSLELEPFELVRLDFP